MGSWRERGLADVPGVEGAEDGSLMVVSDGTHEKLTLT